MAWWPSFAPSICSNRHAAGAAIRLHVLSLPDEPNTLFLESSIKRTVGLELFESIRAAGHAACDGWLAVNARHIGVKSTADLRGKYLERQGDAA